MADTGGWRMVQPRTRQRDQFQEILDDLNRHRCFDMAIPGLWQVCVNWLLGPETDASSWERTLKEFLGLDDEEIVHPQAHRRADEEEPSVVVDEASRGESLVRAAVESWDRRAEGAAREKAAKQASLAAPRNAPPGPPATPPPPTAISILASLTCGDSTWQDLPREVIREGRMHACECTPGGSLTTAKHGRPGAIVRIKERLSRENRGRKILMYAFPLQGANRDSPDNWKNTRSKLIIWVKLTSCITCSKGTRLTPGRRRSRCGATQCTQGRKRRST